MTILVRFLKGCKIPAASVFFTALTLFCFGCAHTKPDSRINVVAEKARACIGSSYRRGGTTPAGFDCSGLVFFVYQAVGVTLPRTVEGQYQEGKKISRNKLRDGDVVFFNTKPFARASICFSPCILLGASVPLVYGRTHSGIYIGNNAFVHASSQRGVVVDNMNDEYWEKRYLGGRRYLQ